ncbi:MULTISPECIES: relaxase MobL [unclassified Oscillibacter]|uniref:relaxase MobL n=1 Tax=unclassified Oscillibacter TaxID=2629304 RepID=UPI0025F9BC73|nr:MULTISPECIES: relaxase MobL [unclassified Oscillibacter]
MADKAPELFVFKQSYKPRNLPDTRVLNQKHLVYIATRPGVMRNPGCGFGLWGKLPDMKASKNIADLRTAHQAVGTASKDHTLYRAILSVGKTTARDYDLYDRETWQKLINTRISVIQREMHIKPEDFRWVAAMHYKKTHPHVHIIYWDNGKEPRQEFVSKTRFELISERVRTTFSRALYFEKELKTVQAEQSEAAKATRLQLSALMKSFNLPEALNLDHVRPGELDELGKGLVELVHTLPTTGRLKYGFLKPQYRERLNAWLEQVMKISDFEALERKYEKLSADVSRLYGNDDALAEKFQKQAHERLFTDLGNETLSVLKEVAAGIREQKPPEDLCRLRLETWRTAGRILRGDTAFEELLRMLPKWGTPSIELLKDEDIQKKVGELTQRLAEDIRIRSKTTGFLSKEGKKADKEALSAAYRAMYQSARAAVLDEIGRTVGEPLAGSRVEPDSLTDSQELHETVRHLAVELLRENRSFQQLMSELPKASPLRQPPLRKEKYQEWMDSVIKELVSDLRLRTLVEQSSILQGEDPGQHSELRNTEYINLYRSMHELVVETMRTEKGYDLQEQQELATMALLRLFRSGSQSKNQLQSQRNLQREKYRNLSETAKRDLRKKRQQEGGWSMEF